STLFLVVAAGVGIAFGRCAGFFVIHGRIVMLHEVRRDVDRIVLVGVVEVERATGELGRDRTARLVFILLERLLLVLRRCGRTKVLLSRVSGAFSMARSRRAVAAGA